MSEEALRRLQPALPADRPELRREVAGLIIQALNLSVTVDEIDPDGPLYGEGLGLDSIDILEIALVLSTNYGIELQAEGAENEQIFRSLRHLVDHIAVHRTK